MNDAESMGGREPCEQLTHHVDGKSMGRWDSPRCTACQIGISETLEHDVRPSISQLTECVNGNDMRITDTGKEACLVVEAVACVLGFELKDLDCDRVSAGDLDGRIKAAMPTAAQNPLDSVPRDPRGDDLGLCHEESWRFR